MRGRSRAERHPSWVTRAKTKRPEGFEPLTFCMLCMPVSSDGDAVGPGYRNQMASGDVALWLAVALWQSVTKVTPMALGVEGRLSLLRGSARTPRQMPTARGSSRPGADVSKPRRGALRRVFNAIGGMMPAGACGGIVARGRAEVCGPDGERAPGRQAS